MCWTKSPFPISHRYHTELGTIENHIVYKKWVCQAWISNYLDSILWGVIDYPVPPIWWHQAITCANVNLPSVRFSDNHPRAIQRPRPSITNISLKKYFSKILFKFHYNDVIMSTMASQITSLTIVYLTVDSVADHRKHQSSRSLAFVWGIHWWPVNFSHKGPNVSIWWHHHVSGANELLETRFRHSKACSVNSFSIHCPFLDP